MSNTSKAEEEQDFTGYAEKEPTDLQTRFTDWIPEVTGFDPNGCKSKAAAFAEGVRLAVSLRMPFQRSPENQELLAERRAAAGTRAEEPAAPKKAAPAKKAAAKKAVPAAAEESPRRRGRPAKAAKAAVHVESEPADEPAEEASEPEAVTPHRARGRGRPARRSRASAEAPF
jgi:hypothetical protein